MLIFTSYSQRFIWLIWNLTSSLHRLFLGCTGTWWHHTEEDYFTGHLPRKFCTEQSKGRIGASTAFIPTAINLQRSCVHSTNILQEGVREGVQIKEWFTEGELLCQKHDSPCQDDCSEGWGTTAKKHDNRDIETTGAEVALLMCCMHSEYNSIVFYNGSTPSKVHEQQEHLKFTTFATECCFFIIQIVTRWITCQVLEGHMHHPLSEASTTHLCTEHSALSQIIFTLPQNNQSL